MPMKRLEMFNSPQHISGAQQQTSVASFSWTAEVDVNKELKKDI